MQAPSVDNPSNAQRPEPRTNRSADEAFDGMLAGAQAAQLLANVGTLVDGSGLALQQAADPTSARRARVDQERATARQAESEAPGPGAQATEAARQESSPRDPRLNAETRQTQPAAKYTAAPQRATSGDASAAKSADAPRPAPAPPPAEPRDPAPRATPQPAPNPPDKSDAAPKPSPNAAAPAADQAVTVATAGAARAAQSIGEGRNASPAQNLARVLAARMGETTKPTAVAQEGAPGRDQQATSKEAAEKPAKDQPAQSRQAQAGKDADNTRRADFHRLVQSLRLSRGGKQSSATIRLDPPTLGRMKVDLRMVNDSLQVRVEAASPEARELLTARAAELTAALREHDIIVERFEVVTVSQNAGANVHQQSDDAARQTPPQSSAGQQTDNRESPNDTADAPPDEDDAVTTIVVDWAAEQDARLDIQV